MSSLLEELLGNPSFGAVVLAAEDEIPQRRPCRAVHLTDLPDPSPWLRGGEIVLTTGISLVGDEAAQSEFVRNLVKIDCVALGYSAFDYSPPPEAIIRTAREVGLPLFTLDFSVHLTDVTMFIMSRLIDRQYVRMQQGIEVHRKVMREVVGSARMDTILKLVGEATPDLSFLVLDYFGGVVAQHGDTRFEVPAAELARGRTEPAVPGLYRDITVDDVKVRLWTLSVAGEAQGFFACWGAGSLDETDVLLLEHAVAGVIFVLARDLSLRQVRRSLVSDLLDALRSGSVSDEVLGQLMERLGISADGSFSVMCIPSPPNVPLPEICRLIEDHLPSSVPVGCVDTDVYAILPAQLADAAVALYDALGPRIDGVRVGVSPVRQGVSGVQVAFRQAQSAARFAPRAAGVFGLEDVAVASMFGSEDPALRALVVNRVLGALLTVDRRENSQLLPTLRAFIAHGCRPGQAAAELFIHRHTLGYRLDKIAKLTGQDPRLGEHLLDYTLALSIYDQDVGS
jgi:purine catabolism regulator